MSVGLAMIGNILSVRMAISSGLIKAFGCLKVLYLALISLNIEIVVEYCSSSLCWTFIVSFTIHIFYQLPPPPPPPPPPENPPENPEEWPVVLVVGVAARLKLESEEFMELTNT